MPDPNIDTTNCEREPIHIPGSIQPHGALLALHPETMTVAQVTENAEAILGIPPNRLLGAPVRNILGAEQEAELRGALSLSSVTDANPLRFEIAVAGTPKVFDAIVHMTGGLLALELEPAAEQTHAVSFLGLYHSIRRTVAKLQGCRSVLDVAECAADEVRALTGFDRVMIYQFDENWNGSVIAEARREDIDSYLGLHFPASDIPRQARELYTKNWLRLIANVDYIPAAILKAPGGDGQPLDLSLSALRSVSPIHREYLRNMGVAASMSISILKENALWGLIACHHEAPKYVSYEVRSACEFLGQILSGQVEIYEKSEEIDYAAERQAICNAIAGGLGSETPWIDALRAREGDVLEMVKAHGAALNLQNRLVLLGQTPPLADVNALIEWLVQTQPAALYATDRLPSEYGEAEGFQAAGSGILAATVSREQRGYVVWFRPEVVETVHWAGDPHKPVHPADGAQQLHPRKSFELWKEVVRQRSIPWKQSELTAAIELKNALVANSLRRAVDDLERSNTELDAFAYVVSHDMRAPLRALGHIGDWIEEDLEPDEAIKIKEHLDRLKRRITQMDNLVAGLLQYARVGRDEAQLERVDVGKLLETVLGLLDPPPGMTIALDPHFPTVSTERVRMQQVFMNLIGNAIKYHDRPDGRITVSAKDMAPGKFDGEIEFAVTDDGPGIPEEYQEKIFGLFQTLGTLERSDSTGIGLALVKRIVEHEGGQIRVRSKVGEGSAFIFTWPKNAKMPELSTPQDGYRG